MISESDDSRCNSDPDDDPPTEEEMAEFDRPLHEVLGIEMNFAPDYLAPPIDEQRLIAFVRAELFGDDRDEIIDLISSFRSWYDALGDVLRRNPKPSRRDRNRN